MNTIHLNIYTPYRHYYDGEVSFIHLRNADSILGILPNHAPLITSVEIAEIILEVDGKRYNYACGGGIFKIKDNEATLLLKSIEREDEIDLQRALNSKQRAEKRLSSKAEGIDVLRAELSLKRALVRLSIKNYTNK